MACGGGRKRVLENLLNVYKQTFQQRSQLYINAFIQVKPPGRLYFWSFF
jgi:hypothetical protein